MSKWIAAVFGAMTLGASALTYYDTGMQNVSLDKQPRSVRQGSRGGHIGGGYRHGK